MCCDGWIQRYFAISCDTVGLPNCVRRPAMDPYVRIDSTQLRRPITVRESPAGYLYEYLGQRGKFVASAMSERLRVLGYPGISALLECPGVH